MDWAVEEGRHGARASAAEGRGAPVGWREGRDAGRPNRRGLEDRLESWVSRGRGLVDGVSGARPGSRPPDRGGERGSGGRPRLEGLGRWVEGRLDWLLDDRDDWQEPWQEADRPPARRWEAGPSAAGSSRAPLEAISRRRASSSPQAPEPPPPPPASAPPPPASASPRQRETPRRAEIRPEAPTPQDGSQDWPEEEAFQVARWRREPPPAPPAANPLANPPPAPPPGRPLPRSTRRR
jgi:hypothetical protein